jgi:hypothetical protein
MKKYFACLILISYFFASCEKGVEPIDGNYATVDLANLGAHYVTDNITVNPKDSLYFSFTISSPRDMKYVSIQKNPVNQTAFIVRDTLTAANKNSYTAIKKLVSDSTTGSYLYRIVAHDAAGTYIGSKDIVVVVSPDFYYYTYRFLYVPDTVAKTNTCYMAATTGEVFSYTNGAANSSKIDFGFYYDTATANKFSLYALSAPQPQLAFYDISSWTKNATIMKKITSPAFNTLLSGASLRAAGTANLGSGTSNKVTALAAGNLVLFKTVGGKIGCVNIVFVNGSSAAKDSYINVDVKIER